MIEKKQTENNVKKVFQGVVTFFGVLWGMVKASYTEDDNGNIIFKKGIPHKSAHLPVGQQNQHG